ncbi:MAG TPA: hypothetical protein PL124_10455 [Candidatus Cloacimonadota bacterium]|nr:hypothetical protein [Candidatus Cloacimonadota bacterium]
MVELEKASKEAINAELKRREEIARKNDITWGVADILRLRKEDKIERIEKSRLSREDPEHPEYRTDVVIVYLKDWVHES